MQLSSELKKAISNLSSAEKDKLLFRLLKHDPALCNRLEYELVEQLQTLEERRDELKKYIRKLINQSPYSPGYLMMDLRSLSGDINRHVKTTRDKYGEVSLSLYMLRYSLELHGAFVVSNLKKAGNFQEYVVKRMVTLLEKLAKLHSDFHIEFETDVNFILTELHESMAPRQAQEYKLPKQWSL